MSMLTGGPMVRSILQLETDEKPPQAIGARAECITLLSLHLLRERLL